MDPRRCLLAGGFALLIALAMPVGASAGEHPIEPDEYGHLSGSLNNLLRGPMSGGVGGGSLIELDVHVHWRPGRERRPEL